MKGLEPPDNLHLQAAQGWLELGNWQEASEELERITPQMRAHLDVLSVRCKIYCDAEKWEHVAEVANALCQIIPESTFGPLHLEHALIVHPKLFTGGEQRPSLPPRSRL